MNETYHYGGQAVIEGVMMRGRSALAVAVRHPSGEVLVHTEPLDRGLRAGSWSKRPFLRGVLVLWDTLALGMSALAYSARVAMEDESAPPATSEAAGERGPASSDEPAGAGAIDASQVPTAAAKRAEAVAQESFGSGLMWGTMGGAVAFAVAVFFVSPLLLTRLVDPVLPSAALSVAFEGLLRIGLFFGYLWAVGRLPDVQRVFSYHGAEHKTINAYEAGEPMRPDRVEGYSVAHPRCGTSFLLYVVVLSIVLFALLGRPSLPLRIASRIVLVPVVSAVAYELIRLSGRQAHHSLVRFLLAPGMALQSLTTRQPDRGQVEVAIAALKRVLEVDAAAA